MLQTEHQSQPADITIYHSPDADDAFMFYGIVSGNVELPGVNLHSALSDIESLNHRAIRGEIDVTAISVHALAYCGAEYAVLSCGASMGGEHYGPRLVTTDPSVMQKPNLRIGSPGELTSATLALRLYLKEKGMDAEIVHLRFDEVEGAVAAGTVDAGVIIHEGQLTLERAGFAVAVDLGAWWWNRTGGLPLPLGINVAKKSLGLPLIRQVSNALRESVMFSMRYREEALQYALPFGRGIALSDADEFVRMYVNERTLNLGEQEKASIVRFLREGAECGFVPAVIAPEFIAA